MHITLSTETSEATIPKDIRAYASHHGATFEAINEHGSLKLVEVRETEMDRSEQGSLREELYLLREIEELASLAHHSCDCSLCILLGKYRELKNRRVKDKSVQGSWDKAKELGYNPNDLPVCIHCGGDFQAIACAPDIGEVIGYHKCEVEEEFQGPGHAWFLKNIEP